MSDTTDLKKELTFLGLFEKAGEIYSEMGERSVLSFIKSSHRLLSKVYHPDLNPENREKALITQQRLNRMSQLITGMKDEEIIGMFRASPHEKPALKRKILVVEDEFGLQEVFRDLLVMEGYDVRVAVDGIDGFYTYKQFLPDLVFTDVVMPKMSGLELIKKIRDLRQNIKVIYMSGFFGIKRLKQELDKEIAENGYPAIAKPFKASAMLELVNEYLNG